MSSDLERALFRPIDVAWLAAYRVLFGLSLAVSMHRFVANGWVDDLLARPTFRFHYWGFGWVEPLSSARMHVLFIVLAGLALAVAAGLAFRVTAPLLAAGLTYIQLIDVSTYLNHYYLAALLAWLLAASPAHRAWSADAWSSRARAPRAPTEHVAAVWLYLFRLQIGIVYGFAALAKLQSDWLVHGQPLGIWLGANTDLPIVGRLFTLEGAPLAMAWAGFLFDATIVGWLSWKRTRPWAYGVVIVFHVFTRLLFDIGMFPVIMTVSALVFFSPEWPRIALAHARRLTGMVAAPETATSGAVEPAAPARVPIAWRAAVAFGVLYGVVQIVMPLRCHLYGGNVLWHEQGMRFSWRVMVRAKGGSTTFYVRETATGRVLHVSAREYLTPFQENEMSSQPDLVLQLAQHIGREHAARANGPVEVRVESLVSLNGRRAARIIDPTVDLTTIRDGVTPASWILPAPEEAPPHTRPVL